MNVLINPLTQTWLNVQCRMIPNVITGVAALNASADDAFTADACWPEGSPVSPELEAAAKRAIENRSPVVQPREPSGSEPANTKVSVACPLQSQGTGRGVVALEVADLDQQQQGTLIQLLAWGAAWLELLLHSRTASSSDGLDTVFDVLASALSQTGFKEAAAATVNALAQRLACERVSLGWSKHEQVRVQAVSHCAHFDPRTNLVRNIERAMDEAFAQDATIVLPPLPSGSPHVTQAHHRLAQEEGKAAVCTVPLRSNDRPVGAFTLERAVIQPFEPATIGVCETTAKLIGPLLELKREHDRPLAIKATNAFVGLGRRLMGPRELRLKMGAAAFLLLVGILAFGQGELRIRAPATLEGTVQRAVVAPYAGYIANVYARAGETVKAGEVLAELDDKDLKLEHRKWKSEREEFDKQYRKALADLDHTEARIQRTKVAQAEAQLDLLNEQLARTRLLTPFDGIVIKGDLSRSLGTPVERGQILFEVAPLHDYRVVLEVDERDISDVSVGQQGFLTLSAMPGKRFRFRVDNVAAVSQADAGHATFRVETKLEGESGHLRPGMQGIGKVEVGERKLIWIWTRRLVGWTQLWLWSWLP